MSLAQLLTRELLAQSLGSVLEQAAFLFAEPVEDDSERVEWTAKELLKVRLEIEIEGERGALWLLCEPEAGVFLAANLLGIEVDDAQATAKAKDAAGELLNIVCGAVLDEACGSQMAYSLGTPEIAQCAASACVALPGETLSLAILAIEDGHRVVLQLRSA